MGHLVAIIAYTFIAALANMVGIEHNLLIYGAGPGWSVYRDARVRIVHRAVAVVQAVLGRLGVVAHGRRRSALGTGQGKTASVSVSAWHDFALRHKPCIRPALP